ASVADDPLGPQCEPRRGARQGNPRARRRNPVGPVPIRIGIGSLVHEASGFVEKPFDLDDLKRCPLYFGEEVIAKARTLGTAFPGFLALDAPDGEWVPLLSSMLPGGAGVMTGEAYGWIKSQFRDALTGAGRLDGCLLSIHGGMMASGEGLDDADADFLES